MWQGVQEHFKANGVDCHGQVTLAVSDHAVCYVGADDDVHCSGATYTRHYGNFTNLGKPGVDQILLTSTYNSADGNSICVHERNHTIECFGANNDWGNFGNGTTLNANTWTAYGPGHAWKRMYSFAQATCALDDTNTAYCAGEANTNYGSTPVVVGTGSTIWMTSFGEIHLDDPDVWRAGGASSYCTVQSGGLACTDPFTTTGGAGHVVDGSVMSCNSQGGPGENPACNLDDAGNVHCSVAEITERQLTARPNLAFAGSLYTDTHCAVGNDGSLWCRSSNRWGELGSAVTSPYHDTEVAPPGSVKVKCN